MTKTELLKKLSLKSGQTQEESRKFIEAFQDVVLDLFKDGIKDNTSVTLPKIGTFKVKVRNERNGVNPSTGTHIKVAGYKTICFKPIPSIKKPL